MIVWLANWLIDWLTGSLIDWLTDWLIGWLIDLSINWLIDWLVDQLIAWLGEWVSEWVSEWVCLSLSFKPFNRKWGDHMKSFTYIADSGTSSLRHSNLLLTINCCVNVVYILNICIDLSLNNTYVLFTASCGVKWYFFYVLPLSVRSLHKTASSWAWYICYVWKADYLRSTGWWVSQLYIYMRMYIDVWQCMFLYI